MAIWMIVVIAILVLVVWLACQPKQGETAANAPDTYQADLPPIPPPTAEKIPNFAEDFSHLPPNPPNLDNLSDLQAEKPHFDDKFSPLIVDPSVLNLNVSSDDINNSSLTPIVISDDLRQQIQQLVADGRTITAVKKLRQQGMALDEARQYLDELPKLPAIDEFGEPSSSFNRAEVESEVRLLLSQNQKIKAIKFVRLKLGYGLKEAKDYVESLGQ
ncbi:ribosomal protein L7/L12 [Acaryochloris sp. IP29b_bin.137]|uniref:ribosomal protein L7/L12 n=1 Tax=Acaryochloris sp. IP29b_bin.137 TaxID=2969217 RepID=UPI0026120A2A|nr:ribosomal protein L7/L12 [Acaryochloris sp. IP29b_bin.137]